MGEIRYAKNVTSSVHAIRTIQYYSFEETKPKNQIIFWSVVFVVSLCFLAYNFASIVSLFLRTPVAVAVTTLSQTQTFPAVTVCNNNPYKKSVLSQWTTLQNLDTAYHSLQNNASVRTKRSISIPENRFFKTIDTKQKRIAMKRGVSSKTANKRAQTLGRAVKRTKRTTGDCVPHPYPNNTSPDPVTIAYDSTNTFIASYSCPAYDNSYLGPLVAIDFNCFDLQHYQYPCPSDGVWEQPYCTCAYMKDDPAIVGSNSGWLEVYDIDTNATVIFTANAAAPGDCRNQCLASLNCFGFTFNIATGICSFNSDAGTLGFTSCGTFYSPGIVYSVLSGCNQGEISSPLNGAVSTFTDLMCAAGIYVNDAPTFAPTMPGSTVTFTCDPGFDLVGNSTSTCLEPSYQWSSPTPLCVPSTTTTATETTTTSDTTTTTTDTTTSDSTTSTITTTIITGGNCDQHPYPPSASPIPLAITYDPSNTYISMIGCGSSNITGVMLVTFDLSSGICPTDNSTQWTFPYVKCAALTQLPVPGVGWLELADIDTNTTSIIFNVSATSAALCRPLCLISQGCYGFTYKNGICYFNNDTGAGLTTSCNTFNSPGTIYSTIYGCSYTEMSPLLNGIVSSPDYLQCAHGIYGNPSRPGSTVHFTCNPGYNLTGSNFSTCNEATYSWSNPLPTCIPLTTTSTTSSPSTTTIYGNCAQNPYPTSVVSPLPISITYDFTNNFIHTVGCNGANFTGIEVMIDLILTCPVNSSVGWPFPYMKCAVMKERPAPSGWIEVADIDTNRTSIIFTLSATSPGQCRNSCLVSQGCYGFTFKNGMCYFNNDTGSGVTGWTSCDTFYSPGTIYSTIFGCDYTQISALANGNVSTPVSLRCARGIVPNAVYGISAVPGSTVYFYCNPGFSLVGSTMSVCNESTYSWTNPMPNCTVATTTTTSVSTTTTSAGLPFDIANYTVGDLITLLDTGNVKDFVALSSVMADFLPYLLGNLTDSQLSDLGYSQKEMFVSCVYNQRACADSDLLLVVDRSLGNCYTFNHNLMTDYTAIRAGLPSGEYADWTNVVGMKIIIHEPGDTVFPDTNGYGLSPGYDTAFSLHKETSNKVSRNSDSCQKSTQPSNYFFYSTDYTLEGCFRGFIQSKVMSTCGCGFYKYAMPKGNITYCGVEKKSCVDSHLNTTEGQLLSTTAASYCNQECSLVQFKPSISMFRQRKLSITKSDKNDMVIARVFFETLTSINFLEYETYEAKSLLTDTGSQMGIWLGMSVVSAVELVCLCIGMIVKLFVKLHRA